MGTRAGALANIVRAATFVALSAAPACGGSQVPCADSATKRGIGFAEFLPTFMAAWGGTTAGWYDRFVDPRRGLWIVYRQIGIFPVPERLSRDALMLHFDATHAKRLAETSLRCTPVEGPAPRAPVVESCSSSATRPDRCTYGETSLDLYPMYRTLGENGVSPIEVQSRRSHSTESDGAALSEARKYTSHFVVDARIGAVFYFGNTPCGWRLIAVDLSAC